MDYKSGLIFSFVFAIDFCGVVLLDLAVELVYRSK